MTYTALFDLYQRGKDSQRSYEGHSDHKKWEPNYQDGSSIGYEQK